MPPISILVATTSPDIKAEIIAESVKERPDLHLLENGVLPADESERILGLLPDSHPCALIMVGRPGRTSDLASLFLRQRPGLLVLQVDVIGDGVQICLRDPRLQTLLDALRDLAERIAPEWTGRIARVLIEPNEYESVDHRGEPSTAGQRPLLTTSFNWLLARLTEAVERTPDDSDMYGLALSRSMLLASLREDFAAATTSDRELTAALRRAASLEREDQEPLAVARRVLGLGLFDFKLLLLALAPELDDRFQRCYGFLLNDVSRRGGSMGLYGGLLGSGPDVSVRIAGNPLSRWAAFERATFSADEPLRLDPHLAQWLLGDGEALARDPWVRRATRPTPWQGACLLGRNEDFARAAAIWNRFHNPSEAPWLVLGRGRPADWKALLELGAIDAKQAPIRVEPFRLAGADPTEIEDCAARLGRMALLTNSPLIIDLEAVEPGDAWNDRIERLLGTLSRMGCGGAIVGGAEAWVAHTLGSARFRLVSESPLTPEERVAAVSSAAGGARAYLDPDSAESLARRHPLTLDALEQAMWLALRRVSDGDSEESRARRFLAACQERAAEGLSNLAERIDPCFELDNVVLPPDRERQLRELVDHVRLAPKVLDGWRFAERLPYGRGVAALFHGVSGTGKTMAAMGVAAALGTQILRFDLSRVVSKYIGDTEKNIDRVFTEAQRSGSAILVDEADAILGKRSEVKDAHDRYANIEVAYLLQRMEAYEGLVILTTNMRRNLDAAIVRRLRFIVEFPRPDVDSRERIWRLCLPNESHELDQPAFRQLAKKVDMTGGHIRQISLHAAFLAAAADARINLKHIADAVRAECAKLGVPPVELDLNDRKAA